MPARKPSAGVGSNQYQTRGVGLHPARDRQETRARQRAMFAARLSQQEAGQPGYAAQWHQLEQRLTAAGGDIACPPTVPDPDIERFLSEGHVMGSDLVVWEPGVPNDCHGNTARLSAAPGSGVSIATGYALSDDGMWRQHSWGVDAYGTVFETTSERSRYFGVVLRGDDAASFYDENA